MESELELLEEMTLEQRRVFLQEQQVVIEERRLHAMIEENQQADEFIAWCVATAERHHEDGNIETAAEYVRLAKLTRAGKHTIANIRTQRETVQWERKKLRTITKSDEPSKS